MKANATVIAGALQLDRPLPLPDHTRVAIEVALAGTPDWRARLQHGLEAWRALRDTEPTGSRGQRFSREQLHERR